MKGTILIALIAALTAGPARAAEPLTIKMTWTVIPSNLTALMPKVPKSVYRHWGKSYVVEPQRMRGSGAALTALAADQIQIQTAGPQALANAVNQAKIDMVVFCQELTTDLPGYASAGTFWVRTDSGINKIEDLKGKVIGVNSYGSQIDGVMQAKLKQHGLEARKDYQIAEVRLPTHLAALKSKRIDMAFLLLPFNYRAEKDPEVKLLFKMADAAGPQETVMFAAKRSWLKDHRRVVVDFLEDVLRFRHWLYDPKTRMQGIEIMSKITKIPTKSYASWVFTHRDNYRDPNGMINVSRLEKNVAFLKSAGMVSDMIDVKAHVDLSYIKEAGSRLKPKKK